MSAPPPKNNPNADPDAFFQAIIEKRDAASKARGKRVSTIKHSKPRPKNTPLWSPDDVDLEVIPPEVKQAIDELIQPIYRQYVVNASDSLEKSLGASIAHLLWLEILDQLDIKREYTKHEAVLDTPLNRPMMIERHLRLIGSKLRLGHFLMRIQQLHNLLAEQDKRRSTALSVAPSPTEIDQLVSQLPNHENPSAQA